MVSEILGVPKDPPPGPLNSEKSLDLKQNQWLFPLTFSSGASLMQSNLDADFLGQIVISHTMSNRVKAF